MDGEAPHFLLEYPCHGPREERWFVMHVDPMPRELGGVVVTHINVTERKRAERAIRDSEQRYKLLFEGNQAGVLRSAEDGRVLDCNRAFARILGYDSAAEVLALNMVDLYHSREDREAVLSQLRDRTSLDDFEVHARRKDGGLGLAPREPDPSEGGGGRERVSGDGHRHHREEAGGGGAPRERGPPPGDPRDRPWTPSSRSTTTAASSSSTRRPNAPSAAARGDVLGRPMADLIIPAAMRDLHHRGFAHYLATGEGPVLGQRVEVPAMRADGSEFPAELAS